jgi:hypothetical protein
MKMKSNDISALYRRKYGVEKLMKRILMAVKMAIKLNSMCRNVSANEAAKMAKYQCINVI